MENERGNLIYLAKLAYLAQRYDDMIKSMRRVCEHDIELSERGRELLANGYKHVMVTKRASLRIISSIETKQYSKENKHILELIKQKREMVKKEFFDVCNDILSLIDSHLIPSSTNVESTVFFYRLKGDYFRYMTEFGSDTERKEFVDHSLESYKVAMEMADCDLAPTNLVRLGLALNFSIFSYEILESTKSACKLAKKAHDEAIVELDKQSSEETIFLMEILNNNLFKWSFESELMNLQIAGEKKDN